MAVSPRAALAPEPHWEHPVPSDLRRTGLRGLLRGGRTLWFLVLGATAVTALLAWARWIDRRNQGLFETGRDVVGRLDLFAATLSAGNVEGLAAFYAPDFSGTRLGLLTRELAGEKDGARHYR